MKRVFVLIAISFLTLSVHAQESQLIELLKEASLIPNDTERLKAYDQILESTGIKEIKSDIQIGKWNVSTQTNPIDDSIIITFILIADTGESVYGDPIVLVIRNSNGENDIYINWNSYLGSEVYVTMRLDSEKSIRNTWAISTDRKASFYPGDTFELIKKMLNAQKLVVQCTPYLENPITAIFDIRGLRDASRKYKEQLLWE